MKRTFLAIVLGAGMLGPFWGATTAAIAAERTVTLDVQMSCPTCPYIVKRSLEGVAGVLGVSVSYDAQTATVRYDDEKTTTAALTQSTAEVGFPSTVASPD